jgi:hypothetical protein
LLRAGMICRLGRLNSTPPAPKSNLSLVRLLRQGFEGGRIEFRCDPGARLTAGSTSPVSVR